MKRILVIGSLNLDMVVNVDHTPVVGETILSDRMELIPGGKGANQACAAGRLGGHVTMLGAVGDDMYGEILMKSLGAAGVDMKGIVRKQEEPTGIALITVNRDGDNCIVVVSGANGALSCKDTPIIIITSLYDPKMCMYSSIHCYRFIEKPFDPEKVKETIREAIKYHTVNTKKKNIYFHVDGLLEMVALDEIMYIESKDHKLHITTKRECFCVPYKSCKAMLEELDSDDFIKCNRGTIVNLSYIKTVDTVNRMIHLRESDRVLEIGPVMKKSFMSRIHQKM